MDVLMGSPDWDLMGGKILLSLPPLWQDPRLFSLGAPSPHPSHMEALPTPQSHWLFPSSVSLPKAL